MSVADWVIVGVVWSIPAWSIPAWLFVARLYWDRRLRSAAQRISNDAAK